MKSNHFLPLLFGMMFLLLSSIAHSQEDDIYFDPEFDEIDGYNDNYSDDEYVDDNFEYNYVDEEIELEVRRIQRFRRTFNFVVVVSDPWLYYDNWGWTCRPRFRYRPYRCWRYDNWFQRRHYAHMYFLQNRYHGHHHGHYHWNHWVNHGYHPAYNGHWGYHHPHHNPWGWYRTAGDTKVGRSSKAGIAASKGASISKSDSRNSPTLAMGDQGKKLGRDDISSKNPISIGKGKDLGNSQLHSSGNDSKNSISKPNTGTLAQGTKEQNTISIGKNDKPSKATIQNGNSGTISSSGKDVSTINTKPPKTSRSNKPSNATFEGENPRTTNKGRSTTSSSKPSKTSRSNKPKSSSKPRSGYSKKPKSPSGSRNNRSTSTRSSSSRSAKPPRSSSSRSSSGSSRQRSSSSRSSSPRRK